MRTGWFRDSYRHSLAARGIRTNMMALRFRDEPINVKPLKKSEIEQYDIDPFLKSKINKIRKVGYDTKFSCSGLQCEHTYDPTVMYGTHAAYLSFEVPGEFEESRNFIEGINKIGEVSGWDPSFMHPHKGDRRFRVGFYHTPFSDDKHGKNEWNKLLIALRDINVDSGDIEHSGDEVFNKQRKTNMMALTIPVGISGSGKSTKLRELQESDPDLMVISPDEIRKELTGNTEDQSRNSEVFRTAHERLDRAMAEGKDVFFDATNVNPKSRTELSNIAQRHNQPVEALVFNTPVRLAKARVARRVSEGGHDVPEKVLKRQRRILGSANVLSEPFSKVELVDWRDDL